MKAKDYESRVCPCGSGIPYQDCCQPFLSQKKDAPTAEALMRSVGDMGTALSLVNEVRNRAGASDLTEINYEILLAERGRELYAEGFRRSDMIRFGVFLDTRWEKSEVSPSYVTLWPIPEGQIQANSNLIQNPGY